MEQGRSGAAVVDLLAEFDQFLLERQEAIADGDRDVGVAHGGVRNTLALSLDDACRSYHGQISTALNSGCFRWSNFLKIFDQWLKLLGH